MATWVWKMRDTDSAYQTIDLGSSDVFAFYDAAWDDPIEVDEWNISCHIETSAHAHECVTYCGVQNTYLTTDTIDIGSGSTSLIGILTTDGCLWIEFSETASTTENADFWSYDGTTDTVVPTGVNFYAAEANVTSNWVAAMGATHLDLGDNATPAATHDFFLALSASPSSTGVKTAFGLKIQLTYQT